MMKVGEAKQRLGQISVYLDDSLVTLTAGPLETLGDIMDKCDEALKEQCNLRKRVEDVEDSIEIGGEPLREVTGALEVLDTKITLLEKIALRRDLSASQSGPLFKQLESYRSTRDTLRLSLEKCLWEFELVE